MKTKYIVFLLCCTVILIGSVVASYFLFDLSEKKDDLIPLKIIMKNRGDAPKMNLKFPAHQTKSFKSCLKCHGLSSDVKSKRENLLNPQFQSLGFGVIPPIPHEHDSNLNCLSCHGN